MTSFSGEAAMSKQPRTITRWSRRKLSLGLGLISLLILCPLSVKTGGFPESPSLASVERQGDYVVLGFEDMTTQVQNLVTGRSVIDRQKSSAFGFIQGILILDDTVALFQTMGGGWLLWNLHTNKVITDLPAMPMVGGLKGFFRIDSDRAAFTYYRHHSPMTIVDLTTGSRREIPSPGKRWSVEQVQGSLFLSLAGGELSLLDLDSGKRRTAAMNCLGFACAKSDRAAAISHSSGGKSTLAMIDVDTMNIMSRRTVSLNMSGLHTNFRMGCDEKGNILHVTERDSVSFFKLPSLEKIGRIAGMNFQFAGTKGIVAYDLESDQPCFCIRNLKEDNPRFCLKYRANVSQPFGSFTLGPDFIWANNGRRLRIWEINSGCLVSDYQVPECFRPEYATPDGLSGRLRYAKLWDQAVTARDRAWVACAEGKQASLYRLGKNGPKKILSKRVPSSFAVFILKQNKKLAHVDESGNIRSWTF